MQGKAMSEGQIVPELLEAHSGIRIIGGAKERNHLPKGKEETITAGFRGPAYNAADDAVEFCLIRPSIDQNLRQCTDS